MSQTTGKSHHSQPQNKLDVFWENLLSRRPKKVLAAYRSLDAFEQKAVIEHLQRMVNEPGWQAEQRLSAQAALSAIEKFAE